MYINLFYHFPVVAHGFSASSFCVVVVEAAVELVTITDCSLQSRNAKYTFQIHKVIKRRNLRGTNSF